MISLAVTITPEIVPQTLAEFTTLLENAAAGKLGPEAVYKAVAVFRTLVGGHVWGHVKRRAGRKRTNVRGVFHPYLIGTVRDATGQSNVESAEPPTEVSVWLREPPLRNLLAPRVYHLIDVESHSYRSAAPVLQAEGYNINSGVVWQLYRRHLKGLTTVTFCDYPIGT